MRWVIVSLVLIAVVLSASISSAQEYEKKSFGYGMGRCWANMGLGWLEVPRCILYENAKIPVVGIGLGMVKGVGLTVWRTTYGVVDFLTLGLIGDKLYSDELPAFVWEAPWFPRHKEKPEAKPKPKPKPEPLEEVPIK